MKSISSAVSIAILIVGFGLSASSARAELSQRISGAQIIEQLSAFLAAQQLDGSPALDKDRQFRGCSKPLAFAPLFGSFKTIEVSCPDADGWKIAVRSQTTQDAIKRPKQVAKPKPAKQPALSRTPTQQIVVMRRSISRGSIISAEDVTISQMKSAIAGGYFTSIEDVVGRVAKRRLNIGKVVISSQLEHDWLIKEGQPVILSAEIGAVSVQSNGIALEDAQQGQMARFLNVSSNKEVFGRVKSEKKIIIRANIY